MDAHQKTPDTYILLAKKISRRANLQRDTDFLCQIIQGSVTGSEDDGQAEPFMWEISAFFDDEGG